MKKTIRKILSIVLAVVMLFSFTTVAYAVDGVAPCAGRETLPAGDGMIGAFTLDDNNLTPVKTMGATGTLWIYGTAETDNNGNKWWIRVEIRDAYSGKVLAEGTSIPKYDSLQTYAVSLNVTKGQEIQIYLTYGTPQPIHDAYIKLCYLLD